jgi:hypothetical protein
MVEKGFKVIPVVSKEVLEMPDKKLTGQAIYQLQKFYLKAGGMFVNTGEATTVFTSVAVISGALKVFGNDFDKVDSQNGAIHAIKNRLAEKAAARGESCHRGCRQIFWLEKEFQ